MSLIEARSVFSPTEGRQHATSNLIGLLHKLVSSLDQSFVPKGHVRNLFLNFIECVKRPSEGLELRVVQCWHL